MWEWPQTEELRLCKHYMIPVLVGIQESWEPIKELNICFTGLS
jgi:hypothetical protein